MSSIAGSPKHLSERAITAFVITILSLTSTVLMLSCASPEFCWDEADYAISTANPWVSLWRGSDYDRHGHGPMMIYLAKLGREVLPAGAGSLEVRLRFFVALVGSLAVGFLYWTLRHCFKASRAAALVGSSLLLFSVIRLEETNVIGPHHLMLLCTVAIVGLGYQWRDRPIWQAGIGLGAVMAFGALSMTYVIPAGLCWAVAVTLTGKGWIAWDRNQVRVSWSIPVMLVTASMIVAALWPPGVFQHVIISNFRWYLHYSHALTLVGDRFVEAAPRSAALYWLANLDAPILIFPISIILSALWRSFKTSRLSSKHAYLAICLIFFLATALAAHLAGSRNLLQFMGVTCLATGALYDEAIGYKPRVARFGAVAIMVVAALNLIWLSRSSSYTPLLATDGYRAFLKENGNRLREKAKALAFNTPALQVYSQDTGIVPAWDVSEIGWTTRADAPLPPDVKYVLMPALVYEHMPPEQPMRRIVAEHWKVVWSHKRRRVWELQLYENPQAAAP